MTLRLGENYSTNIQHSTIVPLGSMVLSTELPFRASILWKVRINHYFTAYDNLKYRTMVLCSTMVLSTKLPFITSIL